MNRFDFYFVRKFEPILSDFNLNHNWIDINFHINSDFEWKLLTEKQF
jgi:hypothetical protein